jgi:glycosyltransferase involved in cell wall biosynthesis
MTTDQNQAPLVTMGLLTHRREKLVREAVRAVLAQTYSPLQIVVCDDASTDSTPEILKAELDAYRGPHRIVFHRNDANMGIRNYNRLMELAQGELIVVAHDDDISRPDRVERLVAAWRQSKCSLLSSSGIGIGEDGSEHGPNVPPGVSKNISAEEMIARGRSPWLFGGALAWERKVFDVFGPLDPAKSAIVTDWILPFRALLLRGIAVVDEPLLKIRFHPQSKSSTFFGESANLPRREILLASALCQLQYMLDTLAEAQAKDVVTDERREHLRGLLLRSIQTHLEQWRTCRNQLLAAGHRARWLPPETADP